jgi:YidC/Oxa1 family membrane protein insertase
MDIKRIILSLALALVGLSLWNKWQIDYPPTTKTVQESSSSQSMDNLVPQTTSNDSQSLPISNSSDESATLVSNAQRVQVKTDVLNVAIDLIHGDLVGADLLDYPLSTEEKNKPFMLLQDIPNQRYIANSDLLAPKGDKIQRVKWSFTTSQMQYQLSPNQDELIVDLKGTSEDGLTIQKEFAFTRGSYLVTVKYKIVNNTGTQWKGYLNNQLVRSFPKEDKSSIFHVGSYTGASYSNPGKARYQKVSFANMSKSNLNLDVKGGWIAMQQHYFLSAWVPNADSDNKFYTQANNGIFKIGVVSMPIVLEPEGQKQLSSQLYIGPEITGVLKAIAPSLDLTVDYGILWFLSSLLFSLMKTINSVVGNWGWSIVLVTVLIKLAFYRLSATSYKSMAGMRKLQPKLQALRERYGDDKAKISQATMELYRQEKVNPLGGCLPIVIQIPVFIALYWVLLESVELRQAPFIFWINDLASADPYHVLPLIMGATMLIQQKLNPAPPDPMQAKVMMFLPVMFTALFWNFPSGLVLYWIVNNTLSILQQWYITRKYSENPPVKKLVATAK